MSPRRVLVTGVTGFVGHALVDEFLDAGWEVVGLGRDDDAGDLTDRLTDYLAVDLTTDAISLPHVDAIVHLAGIAAVGPSFSHPQLYLNANSAMMTAIGEACLVTPGRPRIVVASSGAVFAAPPADEPLTEESSLGFSSPYAVSKILVENQAGYYATRGIDTVVARPFNHAGPGQRLGFLVPDLIQSVRTAQATGLPIRTGDLSTVRDYTDVRDIATAYRLLAEAPLLRHRLYNVCSGSGTSGEQILELILRAERAELPRDVDPELSRPSEVSRVVGDPHRITDELGWRRRYTLEETIAAAIVSSSAEF